MDLDQQYKQAKKDLRKAMGQLEDYPEQKFIFVDKPHFVADHMTSQTPTFQVYLRQPTSLYKEEFQCHKLVGEICLDKSMCSPSRYLSMYSSLTGGRNHISPNWAILAISLIASIKDRQIETLDRAIDLAETVSMLGGKYNRIDISSVEYEFNVAWMKERNTK